MQKESLRFKPLPYAETFLEPSMDQETLHLHYTFHHGDAVKAANKDLAEVKKAIDANTLDTVDYRTKNTVWNALVSMNRNWLTL
jgi:superoxide dismutase